MLLPVTGTASCKMLWNFVFLSGIALAFAQELPSERDNQGYGAPAVPSYNGDVGGGFDFTPFVIIILGLIGISLLFPNSVTLTSVRRRRSMDGTEGKVASRKHALRNICIFQWFIVNNLVKRLNENALQACLYEWGENC